MKKFGHFLSLMQTDSRMVVHSPAQRRTWNELVKLNGCPFFSRQTKNLQFSLKFENLHPCKHFCIIRPTKQKNRCVKNLCRSLLWWSGEFCFEFWWNGNWSWPYNHREIFKVFFFICIIYFFFHLWMSLYII